MVDSPSLDHTFQALASSTRRELLRRLARGPATVGELARPFPLTLAAVSKHLLALESAGLISRTVAGRRTVCRLTPQGLLDARKVLEDVTVFWERQLDALESHLAGEE